MDLVINNLSDNYSFDLSVSLEDTIENLTHIIEQKQGIVDTPRGHKVMSNLNSYFNAMIFTYKGTVLKRNKKISDYMCPSIKNEIYLSIKPHIDIYNYKKYLIEENNYCCDVDEVCILKKINSNIFKVFEDNYILSCEELNGLFFGKKHIAPKKQDEFDRNRSSLSQHDVYYCTYDDRTNNKDHKIYHKLKNDDNISDFIDNEYKFIVIH